MNLYLNRSYLFSVERDSYIGSFADASEMIYLNILLDATFIRDPFYSLLAVAISLTSLSDLMCRAKASMTR